MRLRASYILTLALCLAGFVAVQSALLKADDAIAATSVFPGKSWTKVAKPEELGWSEEKLADARREADTIGSAAVIVVHHGQIVTEWGQTTRRFKIHSIRKSLISALYGIPGLAEKIDLNATMAELGVDDNEPSLTAVEKQATVRDLLKARSGVYHPALAETPPMKRRRPARGSHAPGTFWYYNNWDFNVLGTVFKQRTGISVFEAFNQYLAKPLEMEDFRLEDGQYSRGPDSIHPAYPFWLSARDMARFGLLFARGGKWQGKQIVPAAWVAESTTSYSPATGEDGSLRCGYGYLWWTELHGRQLENADLPAGSFSARGSGGHFILVVPAWDLVIVHRMDTDNPIGPRATSDQFGKLVQLIVDAMPAEARKLPPSPDPKGLPLFQRLDAIVPDLMVKYKVPGVSIVGIENGGIAWERQYGVRTAGQPEQVQNDTIFEAESISKQPRDMKSPGYKWRDELATRAAAGHDARGKVVAKRDSKRDAKTASALYCTPMEYAQFVVELLRRDRSSSNSPEGEAATNLGWEIDTTGLGQRIRHTGSNSAGYSSYCELYPGRGAGIVVMTNAAGGVKLWRAVEEALAPATSSK